MRKRHFSRRLIGLLAAYLVALQALILPLSMPAAAGHAGPLCITVPDGVGPASAPPAGEDHGCPCAAGCGMQCHAPALADGATVDVAARLHAVAAVLVPQPLSASHAPVLRGPQMPRGPPAA